jgi:hypothetical protein
MKHKTSYYEDEQECLQAIIDIHLQGKAIECDPMYFKGNFYKEIPKPKYIYDIEPQVEECNYADARKLLIVSNSLENIILDPPFVFGIHGKNGDHQKNYYSGRTHGIFKDFEELEELYKAIIAEAYRVLKKNGILIFKCQDYTDSRTTMTHCHVWKWALEQGFYAKDIAILNIQKHKIYNGNLTQRHFRKVHTYFWIFKK